MAVRTLMKLRVSGQSDHSVVAAELGDARAVVAVGSEVLAVAVGVIATKVAADSAEDEMTAVAVIVEMTDADQRV